MSRSGMVSGRLQYSSTGMLAPKRSNVNRFLPQGGFQSINASIAAQDQCKIQPNKIFNPDSTGETFGNGSQDIFDEDGGNSDINGEDIMKSTESPEIIVSNIEKDEDDDISFCMPK